MLERTRGDDGVCHLCKGKAFRLQQFQIASGQALLDELGEFEARLGRDTDVILQSRLGCHWEPPGTLCHKMEWQIAYKINRAIFERAECFHPDPRCAQV